MKDRVPTNPGRVLITPENGAAAFYATMTRADDPTQEGDPINKRTFLTDATAAMFGLSTNAVPDDVLNVLSRFHAGMGNEHIWRRTKTEVSSGYTLGAVLTNALMYTAPIKDRYNDVIYRVASEVSVSETGFVSLVNETTVELGAYNADISSFAGKFIYHPPKFTDVNYGNDLESYKIYYVPADATFIKQVGEYVSPNTVSISKIQSVDGYAAGIHTNYVNSPDINAYPQDDGYTYEYLGQLGNRVQVATGSYKGTGAYGVDNPNSLTFDFEPKVVIVGEISTSASDPLIGIFVRNVKAAAVIYADPSSSASSVWRAPYVTWSGNVVSWYSSDSVYSQLNSSGFFTYIALG